MARKRQVIEDPPPADSSSEEKQESSEENDAVQEDSEVEEQEENDAVAEEEEEEEEEENESTDSDTDSTQPSPTASGFTIKPIITKPMDDDVTKPKKPISKPTSKRPAETDPVVEPESKKKKEKKKSSSSNNNNNNNNNGGDVTDEAAKKVVSGGAQRVWSEDDEITLLKGMNEYRTLQGSDPFADMGGFYEYIKKSMHFDLTKNQMVDKIRRLKKKYQNNVQKGQDLVFAKPHEERAFLLSKKIWGVVEATTTATNGVVADVGNSKKKVKQISSIGNSKVVTTAVTLALPCGKNPVLNHANGDGDDDDGEKNGEVKVGSGDFWSNYPCLNGSFEKVLALPEFGKSFFRERMSLVGSDKAGDLEEKWRDLQEEELRLYLKRVELVKQQTELALETIRASRS